MNALVRAPLHVRHALRMRRIHVLHVIPLARTMQRIVFTGEDLHDFTSAAADDHAKLFFPDLKTQVLTLPDLGRGGRGADDPVVIGRHYTIRRFDAQARELVIDFVLHDDGPATRWAAQARVGQALGMGGPKSSFIIPEDHGHYLLIGDDTALPAIGRRLAEMSAGTPVTVLLETTLTKEEYPLTTAAQATIHRCVPGTVEGSGGGSEIDRLLRRISLPTKDTHVWIGAEIEMVRRVRDYLIREEAIPRHQIRAAGYWSRSSQPTGGMRLDD